MSLFCQHCCSNKCLDLPEARHVQLSTHHNFGHRISRATLSFGCCSARATAGAFVCLWPAALTAISIASDRDRMWALSSPGRTRTMPARFAYMNNVVEVTSCRNWQLCFSPEPIILIRPRARAVPAVNNSRCCHYSRMRRTRWFSCGNSTRPCALQVLVVSAIKKSWQPRHFQ